MPPHGELRHFQNTQRTKLEGTPSEYDKRNDSARVDINIKELIAHAAEDEKYPLNPRFLEAADAVLTASDKDHLPGIMPFASGEFLIHWEQRLRKGGQGALVRASSLVGDRHIVVKIVDCGCHGEDRTESAYARALREASLLDKSKYLDGVAVIHTTDDDSIVVAMGIEEKPGKDLRAVIQECRKTAANYSRGSVLNYMYSMRKILAQLLVLSKKGLQHNDVKPENIMMSGKASRLVDFGIARRVDDPLPHGKIFGTPPYMSPDYIVDGYDPYQDLRATALSFAEALGLASVLHGTNLDDVEDQIMEGKYIHFGEHSYMDPNYYFKNCEVEFTKTFRGSPAITDRPVQDFIYFLYQIIQPQGGTGDYHNPFPDAKPARLTASEKSSIVDHETITALWAAINALRDMIQREEKIIQQLGTQNQKPTGPVLH